jgi:hypothetical protein
MTPKTRQAAIASALATLLLVAGLLRGALELFVSHPETVRFSAEGRKTTGDVFASGGGRRMAASKRRSYAQIAAGDPELGGQIVDVSGSPPAGKAMPLLCVPPRLCASSEDVAENLKRWPMTPGMLLAMGLLGAAALLLLVAFRTPRLSGPR